jgi:hypothetical protein
MNWLNRNTAFPFPYYTLCRDPKQFAKFLKQFKLPAQNFLLDANSDASSHFYEKPGSPSMIVVCLGNTKGRSKVEVFGVLVHEAMHIWQDVKQHIHEHNPSKEFEAYTVQFIAQNLMQAFEDGC